MICPYCNQPVDTKVCPYCGAVQQLPEKTAGQEPSQAQASQVFVPVHIHMDSGSTPACRHCGSRQFIPRRRGFSWGWGIFGFFLVPVFGLLLGCIGSGRIIYRCSRCNKRL